MLKNLQIQTTKMQVLKYYFTYFALYRCDICKPYLSSNDLKLTLCCCRKYLYASHGGFLVFLVALVYFYVATGNQVTSNFKRQFVIYLIQTVMYVIQSRYQGQGVIRNQYVCKELSFQLISCLRTGLLLKTLNRHGCEDST